MLENLAIPAGLGALQGITGSLGVGSSKSPSTSGIDALRDQVSRATQGDFMGTTGSGQRGGIGDIVFQSPQPIFSGAGINTPIGSASTMAIVAVGAIFLIVALIRR